MSGIRCTIKVHFLDLLEGCPCKGSSTAANLKTLTTCHTFAKKIAAMMMAQAGLLDASPALVVGAPVGAAAADEFFNGDQGLVSVWDFDYDTIISFKTQLYSAQLLCIPPLWATCLCCSPCFLKQNVEWQTRAQHVALTVDGIRYVTEKHPTCCGLSCTDKGKESKTVPYDKITDCDVQEPAGAACCCCVQNVLSRVHVDTASSGSKDGTMSHELSLSGLRFANEFKQAVWAMKRGELPANAAVPLGARSNAQSAPVQEQMNAVLLREIRDELRELNTHLRAKP